jgi:zinc transport system substrate-binding protein
MFVFFLLVVFTAGVRAEDKKIGVMASILPLADFAEHIGGNRVKVSVMIPPGGNPHTYEPTPDQLKGLSRAKLYIKVGTRLEFEEAWLDKLVSMNKKMAVCDSSRNVVLIEMEGKDYHEAGYRHREEAHRNEKRHHEGTDPHIWLSPKNAVIMVENIKNSLMAIDSKNRDYYQRNAERYQRELQSLDQEVRKRLLPLKNRAFIVFHPAWGYFARDYGLKEMNIEHDAKEPTARQIAHVIEEARKNKIRIIFASPQFSQKSARVIAREMKGRVEFIDPLAGGYSANIRRVTDIFVESLP